VLVAIEHATGDPDPDLGYDCGVAADTASALGGSLSFAREGGVQRIFLALPRDEHE